MTCNNTKEECQYKECFIDDHLKQVCFYHANQNASKRNSEDVARLIAPEQKKVENVLAPHIDPEYNPNDKYNYKEHFSKEQKDNNVTQLSIDKLETRLIIDNKWEGTQLKPVKRLFVPLEDVRKLLSEPVSSDTQEERDSFAMMFANWLSLNNWAPMTSGGLWQKYDQGGTTRGTTADLLELYKQSLLNQ